jgi:hypothetical protein
MRHWGSRAGDREYGGALFKNPVAVSIASGLVTAALKQKLGLV